MDGSTSLPEATDTAADTAIATAADTATTNTATTATTTATALRGFQTRRPIGVPRGSTKPHREPEQDPTSPGPRGAGAARLAWPRLFAFLPHTAPAASPCQGSYGWSNTFSITTPVSPHSLPGFSAL